MVYLDYLERQPVMQGDREFTRQTILDDPTTGELFPSGSGNGPNGAIPGQLGAGGVFVPPRIFDVGGVLRPPTAADFYNFAPDNYLQTPLERWSGGALVRLELTPQLEGTFEFMYAAPRSAQQLAAAPINILVDVPIAADFFAPDTQTHLATFFDEDSDGVATFRLARRLTDVGPRRTSHERDNYRAVAALHGVLASSWEWDAAYTYALNETHSVYDNSASINRILQGMMIDPGTGACLDPSGGCVPVNLFGPNTLSPEAGAFIRIDGINEDTTVDEQTFTAFVRGDVLTLPAGPLAGTIGAEWRRVSTEYAPSPLLATGDAAGFNQTPAVAGAFEVREIFGELLAPLAASAPFAHELELEAGARFTEHSTAGTHWTWKYGLQWRPIESVRVRAMAQRAVRAPNVRELYETPRLNFFFIAPSEDFCAAVRDPIGNGLAEACVAQGMDPAQVGVFDPPDFYVFDTIAGGNPDLGPEIADTLTVGADWEFGDQWRVRLSADYFEIKLRDAIMFAAPLSNCAAAADPNDITCSLVQRDPSGFITLARNFPINYARAIVEGVDVGIAAEFEAPSWLALTPDSHIEVEALATRYLQAASAASAKAPLFDCVGFFGCGTYELLGAVTPELNAVTTLTYRAGPGSLMLRWRYVGPSDNSDAAEAEAANAPLPIMAIPEIDAVHYFDVAVSYDIGERIRLRAGVDNVFEADPPLLGSAQVQANTDPARYDVFGRRFFVGLNYRLY